MLGRSGKRRHERKQRGEDKEAKIKIQPQIEKIERQRCWVVGTCVLFFFRQNHTSSEFEHLQSLISVLFFFISSFFYWPDEQTDSAEFLLQILRL